MREMSSGHCFERDACANELTGRNDNGHKVSEIMKSELIRWIAIQPLERMYGSDEREKIRNCCYDSKKLMGLISVRDVPKNDRNAAVMLYQERYIRVGR